MKTFLTAILLFVLSYAYSQELTFNHLGVEDGLSQNSVLCITQDARGFMWYGTRQGLNKYDSRKFTVYKNKQESGYSISNNYILSLFSDSQKNLWIGTRDGLNRYVPEKDHFNRIPFAKNQHQSGNDKFINCIYEDKKGTLWVGTQSSLYVITDREKPQLVPFNAFTNNSFSIGSVHCIYEDTQGLLWIGTDNGIVQISNPNNHFEAKRIQHTDNNITSLTDNQVSSIVEDRQHNIWIGTFHNGLNLYNANNQSFTHFLSSGQTQNSIINNHIRKLLIDKNGNLWIGTQEGLSVMDMATSRISSYHNESWDNNSISQNSIHSLYMDNVGTIWIGTFFGGINSYFSYNTPFTVYSNKSFNRRLSNNVVSSITEDEKRNLWIGTEGGGLNYVNRQANTINYFTNNPADTTSIGSNLVKVVYKDKQGNIWAGTHGGGLNLYNTNKNNFTRYLYDHRDPGMQGFEISCLMENSKGLFWIGTEMRGLLLFKKKGTTLTPYKETQNICTKTEKLSILSLLEASNNNIWVGTTTGLFVANSKGEEIGASKGSASLYVNCLTEDKDNNVWVGTSYNGLLLYDKNGIRQAAFTQHEGLPDNNVLGILQDEKGLFWISTSNGLAKFDPVSKAIKTYNKEDGIAGNVFNNNAYYKNLKGELFFGGYDGLTSFYPTQILENNIPPPVILTSLKLFNQTIETGGNLLSNDISFTQELSFKHDQNVLTIDFAILNFIKSGKNRYAYKLEKFDKDWNYTDLPSANYTNVPPGNYRFVAKGCNNDGIWGQPVSIGITIHAPFWKTWWAYTAYALIIVVLAFFILRYFFLRALLKRNNELTQLKLNFFTNISHEIRTHLSLIIGPAEKLIRIATNGQNEKQELQTIKSNSESLLQLVNELMDFRKAETGHLVLHLSNYDMVAFINSIYTSFLYISMSRNIETKCTAPAESIEIYFDKEQMEKVFYNLLSNAFKFTPEGSSIAIEIQQTATTLTVTVTNNGKGIAKENIDKLFDNYFQEDDNEQQNTGYGIGLALSKSIIEMHKGKLSVTSKKQEGTDQYLTAFTVTLLKGSAHFSPEQLAVPITQKAATEKPILLQQEAPKTIQSIVPTVELKQTVLLVEDNKAIRSFIKESLQNQYIILESTNGLQGWEHATENMPDLIISDVMMPEMDGLTLCNKLKTDIRTSHIPVILLTAKTAVAHQVSGLETGADIYLTKPFSIQVLELQIRNLFAARERLWKQFRASFAPSAKSDGTGLSQGETTKEDVGKAVQAPVPLHPLDEAFLKNIMEIIETNMENPEFGIAMLSKKAAMSQPVLFKKIKAITGMAANDFVKSLRLKKAAILLQENHYTVYEVANMVGYESSRYFGREFKKEYGIPPSEYTGIDKPGN